jgi:hypothetical protein
MRRRIIVTTIVATLLWAVLVWVITSGMLTVDDVDVLNRWLRG